MDRWPRQSPRERQLEGKRFARMIVIWVVAPHPSSAEWKYFNTRATQLRIGALHRGLGLYRDYITNEDGEFYGKEYLERKGSLTLCGFYTQNIHQFQPEGGHHYPILDQQSISNSVWNIDKLDAIAQNSLTSRVRSCSETESANFSPRSGTNRHVAPIGHDRCQPVDDPLVKPRGHRLSTPGHERDDIKRGRAMG